MTQQILEKSFIAIENFYGGEVMPDDGKTPDYYPAICRAQALPKGQIFRPGRVDLDSPPLHDIIGTYDENAEIHQHPFLRIVFRPVTYSFSQTIEIVRPLQLLGAGQYSTSGTVFQFPLNKGGIIVHATRGGLITSTLQKDDLGRVLVDANGDALIDQTKAREPSYKCARLVNRSILGNRFEGPEFNWTVDNFRKTHGANSIIQGIVLRGNYGSIKYDIFPDMQIITNAEGTEWSLFNPYENQNRTSNADGTEPLQFDLKEFARLNLDAYSSVSHATKAAHGITSFTRVFIRDCSIENFAGHGIYIFGNTDGGVASVSEIRNVSMYNCLGNGIHLYGCNTSNLSISGILSTGCEGWGIVNSVTNSSNTILTSIFENYVKGGFLCPLKVYNNSFNNVQPVNFAPTARSLVFPEMVNQLTTVSLSIIGCHAESVNYSTFPSLAPDNLFAAVKPPIAVESDIYAIVPFSDTPVYSKSELLAKIISHDVLSNQCLIIGDAVGNPLGNPMVIWPGGNIRPI